MKNIYIINLEGNTNSLLALEKYSTAESNQRNAI